MSLLRTRRGKIISEETWHSQVSARQEASTLRVGDTKLSSGHFGSVNTSVSQGRGSDWAPTGRVSPASIPESKHNTHWHSLALWLCLCTFLPYFLCFPALLIQPLVFLFSFFIFYHRIWVSLSYSNLQTSVCMGVFLPIRTY